MPALPAARDTLQLQTGTAEGVVYTITMKVNGKSATYNRTQFTDFTMGEDSGDSLKLKDGTVVKGTLDSLRISTLGGLLTYKRTQFTGIAITPDALDDLHKDYLARRYSVDEASPEDLFKLAQWCMEKKLKPEAFELARMSIDVDMNSSVAEDAHAMLGEVWDVDKWISKADAPETTEPGETATEAAGAELNPQDDPATALARKNAAVLYRTLVVEYEAKMNAVNAKNFKDFVRKYKPSIGAADARIRSLQTSITALDKRIRDLRDDKIPNEPDVITQVPALTKQMNDAIAQLGAHQKQYQEALAQRKAAIDAAMKARDALNDRINVRKQRMKDLKQNIPRLINQGKIPSNADMVNMFKSVIR